MLFGVLGHVDAYHRTLVIEEELRERLGQLRLTHARRAEEKERTGRTVRVGQPGTRATNRIGHRTHGIFLADEALSKLILHMQELVRLSLQELARRNSGPRLDHFGNLRGADLLGDHRLVVTTGILLLGLRFRLGNLTLNCRNFAVLQSPGLLPAPLAHGQVQLGTQRVELDAQVTDAVVTGLLGLPASGQSAQALLTISEVRAQLAQPLLGSLIQALRVRLGQVGLLHAEAVHAAAQLVDFDGRGVQLHAQARGGLINQVDRLVGQLAPRDVAVRQGRGSNEGTVGDRHLVVGLVLRSDTAQDRNGVLDRGLADEHLLEAALKRRILLDVLTVLVEGGRADHAQLATGEHGLEHVARVHRTLGAAARTNDGVQLVDEGDDLAIRARNLGQNRLQALLEFAAVLRAGDHRCYVEGDEALVAQGLRDVARNDALGEAFDDGRLADAGFTDEDRVVLGTAGQDLDDAANLVVAANDRVELTFARHLGQVAAVLGQGLEGPFRVGRGNRVGTQLRERLSQRISIDSSLGEDAARLGLRCGQRDEQMLGRDVLVAGGLGALTRVADDREQGVRGLSATSRCALGAGQRNEGVAGARTNRARIGTNGLEQGERDTLALFNQCLKQMDRLHLRVTGCTSSLQRRGDGLLRLRCHFTCHEITPPKVLVWRRRVTRRLLTDTTKPKLSLFHSTSILGRM